MIAITIRLPFFCMISHFRHGAPPSSNLNWCVLLLRRCFLLLAWACSFVPSFPEAPCTFSSLGPQFGFPGWKGWNLTAHGPVASGWSGLRSSIATTRTTWLCSWCTCCGSYELSGQTHCVPWRQTSGKRGPTGPFQGFGSQNHHFSEILVRMWEAWCNHLTIWRPAGVVRHSLQSLVLLPWHYHPHQSTFWGVPKMYVLLGSCDVSH